MADKKNKKKTTKAPKAELRSEEKEHKSTAEEPDEFVAGVNRWGQALRPHAGKIAAALLLLVGLGVVWVVYDYLGDRKAKAATTEFARALAIADREVVVPDPDVTEPPALEPDTEPPFPSREARAKAILTAIPSNGALAPQALLRARALMDSGAYDDAARAFAVAAKSLAPEAAISARMGVGYAYEAKAEASEDAATREAALTEALKAFQQSQPAESGLRRDVAMFHEARILSVMGKRDEAVAAFQKILDTKPDTTLKSDIETRLQRLGGSK